MKRLLSMFIILIVSSTVYVCTAQASLKGEIGPWQPANGNIQIPIWPDKAPVGHIVTGPEGAVISGSNELKAGKPFISVHDVDRPTMTVYSPKGKNTGAAIVVFPGGGYQVLSIDLEGTEACDWATSIGVTCILLKYRVPNGVENRSGPFPNSAIALQDAQRAIGIIRRDSAKWKIDPKKIGVIGFSAGGHLVAAISTNYKKRLYTPIDSADSESCRPDFAIPIYPGYMANNNNFEKGPNPNLPVSVDTPPTLLIHAQDDKTTPVEHSLLYYTALKKHKVPTEMHLFAGGGHGFGLRPTEFPITNWPEIAEKWLTTIGMIPKKIR